MCILSGLNLDTFALITIHTHEISILYMIVSQKRSYVIAQAVEAHELSQLIMRVITHPIVLYFVDHACCFAYITCGTANNTRGAFLNCIMSARSAKEFSQLSLRGAMRIRVLQRVNFAEHGNPLALAHRCDDGTHVARHAATSVCITCGSEGLIV